MAMNESREDFLRRNSLPDRQFVAMLAGSRKAEISTMMPVLTEFAAKMHSLPEYADYKFIIAGAPARNIDDYSAWLTAVYDIVLSFKIGQSGQNTVFIPLKTDFSIFKLYRHNNSSRRFVV